MDIVAGWENCPSCLPPGLHPSRMSVIWRMASSICSRLSEDSEPMCQECQVGQVQWFVPIIPALERLRQEDGEFKVSLGYIQDPGSKKKLPLKYFTFFHIMTSKSGVYFELNISIWMHNNHWKCLICISIS
jgi:hypothetical protein